MNPAAIFGIKKTAKACAYVRNELSSWIKPGITTLEINNQAINLIRETGAISAVFGRDNFPGHICICLNQEVAHYSGTPQVIQAEDIIKIDISLRFETWVADCATSLYHGENSTISQLIEANKNAVQETSRGLCPGLPIRDISSAINCQKEDFHYFDQLTGHGTGNKLHAEPTLISYKDNSSTEKTKAGQILAIEAVFSLRECELQHPDNLKITTTELNAHHEETVLITANGSNILTKI